MSIERTTFVLSNLNALMGSAANALEGKKNGDDWGTSIMNFGLHTMTGGVRNAVARDIYNQTGSSIGHVINGLAGYGNTEADKKGMQGLFGASMLTNPWFGGGFFGSYPTFGCSPFGGGMFGGYWGGGMMMGAPPMAMMMGPSSYTEVNIRTSGGCHHGHWRC